MPLKIESKPVTKEFKLSVDPTGETLVIIRQATVGEHQRRYDLLAEVTFVVMRNQGNQEIRQRINVYEQMRLDAYCSLSDCNIIGPDGGSLFKFRDGQIRNQVEFNTAWDSMPPGWAEEIHRYILQVNPDWDPSRGDFPPLD